MNALLISMTISVKAFCLVGSTIDDCAIEQEIYKNGKSVGNGLVTKASMVRHLSSVSNLPVYVVPSDVWLGVWVRSDSVWEKDIEYFKPVSSGNISYSCNAANFKFVTMYDFGEGSDKAPSDY